MIHCLGLILDLCAYRVYCKRREVEKENEKLRDFTSTKTR
jgi:hypothetical protein